MKFTVSTFAAVGLALAMLATAGAGPAAAGDAAPAEITFYVR